MGAALTDRLVIRPARPEDAFACAAIYNQGIAERQATFETAPTTPDEFARRISDPSQPLLVAARDSDVLAWAGVIRSSDRCAYSGVGEYTIYVDGAVRAGGVGTRLLEGLVEAAERAGYWKLIGKLFTTNAASIALARRCGFREVGVHQRHGRLDGQWKDVLIVERSLGDAAGLPG